MSGHRPMHPLRRLRMILSDVRQMRLDVEWWNKNRTDAEPFDVGPYLVFERVCEDAISAWGTGDFEEKHRELLAAARRFADFDSN